LIARTDEKGIHGSDAPAHAVGRFRLKQQHKGPLVDTFIIDSCALAVY
jgi:hypothetical protein